MPRHTGVVSRLRAGIYDAAIAQMTARWYGAVLERLPASCRLLDVGIGTGRALLANAHLLASRDLRVTGIDIDGDYVARCRRAVAASPVADRVGVRLESVYDHRGGPYDAVYFGASFMLLPEPVRALRHVQDLLGQDGRLYFTQTFEHRRSRAIEVLKPMLRLLTTIDFGRVTYELDFRRALRDGGVAIEEFVPLEQGARRAAVLVVGRPFA